MKWFCAILLVALSVFAIDTKAGVIQWGTNPGGEWGTAANWVGGILPGTADTATIRTAVGTGPTFSSVSGTQLVGTVTIGEWSNSNMLMTGGTLGVNNVFAVGYKSLNSSTLGNSTFTMTGGYIGNANTNYAPQQLWVGYSTAAAQTNGTMDMSSSSRVDVRWAINIGGGTSGRNTVGHLNMSGNSQIHLWQTLSISTNGSNLDLRNNAQVALWNTVAGYKSLADVQAMIADGRITAYGLANTVRITQFDNLQGGTGFLLSTPEPATMLLLGLGGLCFLRRK